MQASANDCDASYCCGSGRLPAISPRQSFATSPADSGSAKCLARCSTCCVRQPKPGSSRLRAGRHSAAGQLYLLTTATHLRQPILDIPEYAQIVLDAIRSPLRIRYFMVDAAVVMPDHIHIAGSLQGSRTLDQFMRSLKGYTGRQLCKCGLTAPVWQSGYHDHAARSVDEYRDCVQYLLENPLRAGLVHRVADYPFLLAPDDWLNG